MISKLQSTGAMALPVNFAPEIMYVGTTNPMRRIGRYRFSLVLPFRNEQKRLPRQLQEYHHYINKKNLDAELICVDDCSADNTWGSIKDLNLIDMCMIRLEQSGFKYGAICQGFKIATAPIVGFVDTDWSFGLAVVFSLFEHIEANIDHLDMVIGSRFTPGRSRLLNADRSNFGTTNDHSGAILTFRYTNFLSRMIYDLPYTDVEIGLKVLKREYALQWASEFKCRNNVFFDAEMLWLLRKNGARIVEIPIEWTFHDSFYEDTGKGRPLLTTLLLWPKIVYFLLSTRAKHL